MSEFKELLSLSTDQSVGESVSWSVKMSESIIHYATSKTPQHNHASLALYRHSDSNPSCQSGTSEFGVQTCLKATCQHSVRLINPEKNQEYERKGMGSKSLKSYLAEPSWSISQYVSQSISLSVGQSVSQLVIQSVRGSTGLVNQSVGRKPASLPDIPSNNQSIIH